MTWRQLIDRLGRVDSHLLDDDVTYIHDGEAFAAHLRQITEDSSPDDDFGLDDNHLVIARELIGKRA